MTETEPDSSPETNNQRLVEELSSFRTFAELRRSDAFKKHALRIGRLLNEPKVYERSDARPKLRLFLRVVEWNIERGARLEGIIDVLTNHRVLSHADLWFLNELDEGMLRSGNRNIARELSEALGAHAIYAVEYLEMTNGVGDELKLEGRNTAALHGNAILTRRGFSNPRIVRLSRCEKNFESSEKRLGGRVGLLVDIEAGGGLELVAATTHLDVVNTPRCRARQLADLLRLIDSEANRQGSDAPVIFGGDLNTHTFSRGGFLRASRNTLRLLASDKRKLADILLNPKAREPALAQLARFGYEVEKINDRNATGRAVVSSGSDARLVPAPLRRWALRRIGSSTLVLEFKLDWFATRGLKSLSAGEATDFETGVESVSPHTVIGLTHEGEPISDHDPIVVDVALRATKTQGHEAARRTPEK